MLTTKERGYAIFKAFYFGIMPSWFYEPVCHYADEEEKGHGSMTYTQHLMMNLRIVRSLVRKTEHECTHKFHKMKVKKWTRWQY